MLNISSTCNPTKRRVYSYKKKTKNDESKIETPSKAGAQKIGKR